MKNFAKESGAYASKVLYVASVVFFVLQMISTSLTFAFFIGIAHGK
jgi:hypothetical protein